MATVQGAWAVRFEIYKGSIGNLLFLNTGAEPKALPIRTKSQAVT
jgi:hypothetical protein